MLTLVECRGNAAERGRQYGEQAREAIRRNVEMRSGRFPADQRERFAAQSRAVLGEHLPAVLEEIDGIAAGAGLDPTLLLLENQVDTFAPAPENCTTVVLRESPAGPVVAKNNDAPAKEDYAFVIRRCHPEKGLPLLQVTYAGWLSGLDAINAAGLANTHGSVGSRFERSGPRVDIRLQAYDLMLTCRTTDEFLRRLGQRPLTGKGFSIAIGDAAGDTAIIDAAVPFYAVRERGRPFAFSTNLYHAPGLEQADARPPQKRPVCLFRGGYLRWVAETDPPRDPATIRKLLAAHEPWSPCRHGGPHGSRTVWSMLALPQAKEALVADGPPCANAYRRFGL